MGALPFRPGRATPRLDVLRQAFPDCGRTTPPQCISSTGSSAGGGSAQVLQVGLDTGRPDPRVFGRQTTPTLSSHTFFGAVHVRTHVQPLLLQRRTHLSSPAVTSHRPSSLAVTQRAVGVCEATCCIGPALQERCLFISASAWPEPSSPFTLYQHKLAASINAYAAGWQGCASAAPRVCASICSPHATRPPALTLSLAARASSDHRRHG